jgi:RNA polymerase sigma factor (sigma-70 family)
MTARIHAAAPEADDAALIAEIAQGQLAALGVLFERYEPALRRYLGRLGVSASDADDLVQASFLEVVRAAPRFDPRYAARSWLFGVATQMARRQRRSLRRTAERIAVWSGMSRDPGEGAVPAAQSDTADLHRVAAALEGLSDKKRAVFVLVTLEGFRGEEVATMLQIPLKTVWTRLHHARRELRAALPEYAP